MVPTNSDNNNNEDWILWPKCQGLLLFLILFLVFVYLLSSALFSSAHFIDCNSKRTEEKGANCLFWSDPTTKTHRYCLGFCLWPSRLRTIWYGIWGKSKVKSLLFVVFLWKTISMSLKVFVVLFNLPKEEEKETDNIVNHRSIEPAREGGLW